MKVLIFLSVFGAMFVPSLAQTQKNIGCYVDGECLNSVSVGFYSSNGTTSCYDFCKDTPGCNYFTNYPTESLCFAFLDCVNFSPENCADCTSGEVSCPALECDVNSECVGTILGFEFVASTQVCANTCLNTDNCDWWTFDSSDGLCALYQDCLSTVECTTCTCLLYTSPSPRDRQKSRMPSSA